MPPLPTSMLTVFAVTAAATAKTEMIEKNILIGVDLSFAYLELSTIEQPG
jgi:hypothetical protein